MFFRTWLALGLAFTLGGCGLRLGERPAKNTEIGFGGNGYNCVGEIPQHLTAYVNDQLSDDQINGFMHCLEHAFTSFAELTRGGDSLSYTPNELRNFLQTYFLKDQVVSDSLLREFMVIKQTMVGGTADRFSRAELYQAVGLLEDLRKELVRLRPHMRILNPNLAVKQDQESLAPELAAAYDALHETIKVFTARLKQNKQPYSFSHFQVFFEEFRNFIKWKLQCNNTDVKQTDPDCADYHSAAEWANFLRAFNEAMVSNDQPDLIRPQDWMPLLDTLSRWYMAFLHYQVGVAGKPVLSGTGLQNLIYLGDEVLSMCEAAVIRQPTKTITFPQLQHLLTAIYPMHWLPENLRLVSLQQAMQILLTRVFGDSDIAPSERRSQGLTLEEIADMRSNFYRWAYIQLNIDNSYPSPGGQVPHLQSLNTVPLDARKQLLQLSGANWEDFQKITTYMRPLYAEGGGNRVTIVPEKELGNFKLVQQFDNLSRMNLLRSLVALIFRGYIEQDHGKDLWSSGITDSEWTQFFTDFRELTIDVGLVDARTTNTGERTFVEGNLFTYQSNGLHPNQIGQGNELNALEAMELFAFLYSGGDISYDLRRSIGHICPLGRLDIAKHRMVERACVADHLGDYFTAHAQSMPFLKKFLESSTPTVRTEFTHILLATAYSTEFSDPKWVESSEFSTMAVIAQYAETLMTRFDANQDGLLDNSELEQAIPMFTGYIQQMAKQYENKDLNDSLARGVLLFILDHKFVPESNWDDMEATKDSLWAPGLSLDRLALSKVFFAIGQKLVNAGAPGASGKAVDLGGHTCAEIAFGRGCPPKNPMRTQGTHLFAN